MSNKVLLDKAHYDEGYKQWLDLISLVEDPHYYESLYKYAHQILEDDKNTKSHIMCVKLNVNPQQLSTLRKMLQAYLFSFKPLECLIDECDARDNRRFKAV